MKDKKFIKKSSALGLKLLRRLSEDGFRIFRLEQARNLAGEYGLSKGYIPVVLHHLKKDGWILSLHRGLYALGPTLIGGSPLHEFEIAMALVSPAAISHWSALHYYGLTDQIPHITHVLTSSDTIPRCKRQGGHRVSTIQGASFQFIQVNPHRYFGIDSVWVGDAKVNITDFERTLLDALMMPKYCGDFNEVMHAFQQASHKLNIKKIVDYALRLDVVTSKRLGWILSKQGTSLQELARLKKLPMKGFQKLDVGGPSRGACDSTWGIQVNNEEKNT